jgi:glycosyltransferase involved in cell wall biosynthesis
MVEGLLSIGIPAYNRPAQLERAVRSVLAQSWGELEVVVSDDASPDRRVAEVGRRLAVEDDRVRFVRQEANLGHARNYRHVLEQSRGEWFMWLADDDWLDDGYVARCLEELGRDGARLVCGRARYYGGEGPPVDERPIDLVARRPGMRVVAYYARVNMNGPLFGVARRADMLEIPFQEVPAGDWLLVAAMAARGRVRTLCDVRVHRSMDGLGGDQERLARSFGFTGALARWHHVWVAGKVWRELVAESALTARGPGRLAVATLSAALVLSRFSGAQLLRRIGFGPVEGRLVALARWRRGRSGA